MPPRAPRRSRTGSAACRSPGEAPSASPWWRAGTGSPGRRRGRWRFGLVPGSCNVNSLFKTRAGPFDAAAQQRAWQGSVAAGNPGLAPGVPSLSERGLLRGPAHHERQRNAGGRGSRTSVPIRPDCRDRRRGVGDGSRCGCKKCRSSNHSLGPRPGGGRGDQPAARESALPAGHPPARRAAGKHGHGRGAERGRSRDRGHAVAHDPLGLPADGAGPRPGHTAAARRQGHRARDRAAAGRRRRRRTARPSGGRGVGPDLRARDGAGPSDRRHRRLPLHPPRPAVAGAQHRGAVRRVAQRVGVPPLRLGRPGGGRDRGASRTSSRSPAG